MDWLTRSIVDGLLVAAACAAGVVLVAVSLAGMCPSALASWWVCACIAAMAGLAWVWFGARFLPGRFADGLVLLIAGAVTAKLLVDAELSWEHPSQYRGLGEVLGACVGGTIGLATGCRRGASWSTRLWRSSGVLVLVSVLVGAWFHLQDRYGAASRLRGEDVRYLWRDAGRGGELAIWAPRGSGDWLGEVEGSFGIEIDRGSGDARAESRGMMDEQQLDALADSLLQDMRRRIDAEIERGEVPAVFRNLPLRGSRVRASLRALVLL